MNKLWELCVVSLMLSAVGCGGSEGGDNSPPPPPPPCTDCVIDDEPEVAKGEIGMTLEVSDHARLGYSPAMAKVTLDRASGPEAIDVEIEPYTFLGNIRYDLDNLALDEVADLREGVNVNVDLIGTDGNMIEAGIDLGRITFQSDPTPRVMKTALSEKDPTIKLDADVSYYVQQVDQNGVPKRKANGTGWAMRRGSAGNITVSSGVLFDSREEGNAGDFRFKFHPVPGEENTFFIQLTDGGNFLRVAPPSVTTFQPLWRLIASTATSSAQASDGTYKFVINKVSEGVYQINFGGNPLRVTNGVGITWGTGDDIYWRIVTTDIDWRVQDLGSEYTRPLLPSPASSFANESYFENCNATDAQQEVGRETGTETTVTVGWEQSISLLSRQEDTFSWNAGLEVEGKFFGNGAKYTADIGGEYTSTTEFTSETTTLTGNSKKDDDVLDTRRTITVQAGTAVNAYDSFQKYTNVKVPFVQRLLVTGFDIDNPSTPLNGQTLKTQFTFSKFDGVVVDVGATSIEVVVKGVATLDDWTSVKSIVRQVEGFSCS